MAKGIYERKGLNGAATYYIRYQYDGTDIKERIGRKSRGFTREMAKDALKSRLGDVARGNFDAVLPSNLAQNRNIFLVRRGRGLGIGNDYKRNLEAASGFEPLHRGFADLSLNHLGTPPRIDR